MTLSGIKVDLDQDFKRVETYKIVHNFFNIHVAVQVVFNWPETLDLMNEKIKFLDSEWQAYSYRKVNQVGAYYFSAILYPSYISFMITKQALNFSSLVNCITPVISFKGSDFQFISPFTHFQLVNLLTKYRVQILEENGMDSFENRLIYCDQNVMYSNTYNEILNSNTVFLDLSKEEFVKSGYEIHYANQKQFNLYYSFFSDRKVRYSLHSKYFFDKIIILKTPLALPSLKSYQCPQFNEPEFKNKKYILIKSVFDSKSFPASYTHTFALKD